MKGNNTGLGYQHFLPHYDRFETLGWIWLAWDGLKIQLHGPLYNWFNIRTRSPLNLLPNSNCEQAVVVTIFAEDCPLNFDLISKIN
jgi:hypothetical protein